ncbi:DUF6527 family protein [Variovorax sp. GB1P17]|uniref:DUF6527 family protein n=1 Tax=Variovorax sp. GB1P17 TaxID=3443740 RepID=UPI003F45EE2C
MKQHRMAHVFVEEIPVDTEQGVLYVSMECATAIHRCACGCGKEVVTPLSPTDWSLIFDGDTVSLDPSIGNWSLPCRAHYFIDRGTVAWAGNMSNAAIELGRSRDRRNKAAYFSDAKSTPSALPPASPGVPSAAPRTSEEHDSISTAASKPIGIWQSLKTWWKS